MPPHSQMDDLYVLDLASGVTTSFNNVDDSYSFFFGSSNMDAGDKVAAFTLVAGDYNGDGKVDAADYVLWRNDRNAVRRTTPSVTTRRGHDFWRGRAWAAAAAWAEAPRCRSRRPSDC